jgi:SWI/SNF-related matrix-associated actin-dependent regulator of chromatin subfamily A3
LPLLKFLRVDPYSDPEAFDADFMELLKVSADESIARLKTLFKCLVLRRSSSTIQLPERTDQIHYLDFTSDERAKYDEARAYTIEMLDTALNTNGPQGASHLNTLQQINALRIICNLGMLAPSRPDQNLEPTVAFAGETWDNALAQAAFNTIAALGQAICTKCGLEVSVAEPGNVELQGQRPPHLSHCVRLICSLLREAGEKEEVKFILVWTQSTLCLSSNLKRVYR